MEVHRCFDQLAYPLMTRKSLLVRSLLQANRQDKVVSRSNMTTLLSLKTSVPETPWQASIVALSWTVKWFYLKCVERHRWEIRLKASDLGHIMVPDKFSLSRWTEVSGSSFTIFYNIDLLTFWKGKQHQFRRPLSFVNQCWDALRYLGHFRFKKSVRILCLLGNKSSIYEHAHWKP
jgi:hypothetical protein